MRIKIMNRFMKRIIAKDVIAITLAPFGIYIDKEETLENGHTLTHEKIHWKQQIEMLIIPFYLWYVIEWLIKLLKYGKSAYYQISLEKEAYSHQSDATYLITRKHYAWIKLLTNKTKNG